jgi:hypothetical protein
MGHVWTAPWQELSDVLQHWSGAVTCPACFCGWIWPLALMLCADRVPNKNAHSRRRALTQAGSPDPRNNRICITSSCPRQLVLPIYPLNLHHAACSSFGSLYLSPPTMMAQAIRAILLASATAATLVGRRSINLASHGRLWVPCLRA